MKRILTLLTAIAFASASLLADAAPRAAEDPSASVVSTSGPAPKAKKQALNKRKAHQASHKMGHKTGHKMGKKSLKKSHKKIRKNKRAMY